MDREIKQSKRTKRVLINLAKGAAVLLGIALAIFAIRTLIAPKANQEQIVFATVTRGDLENTFTARGLVKPETELLLTSPISTTISKVFLEPGSQVKPGTTIISLNTEAATLEYSKLQDELKMKNNNVNRLQLSLQKNIRDIEIDHQIKELEVKNYQAQWNDIVRLQEIGGATQDEVEQAKQRLQIAQLEQQKLDNELNYRKSSFEADVKNEELQSSIQEKVLSELDRKIRLTNVTSPVSGVLTWVNQAIGTQVDTGSPLARIANLNSFSIEGTASDRFAEKIAVGLPVRIKINKEFLNGFISQILPNIENNTVQFRVQLDEPSSPLLKPNMQVELFIVEDTRSNTLILRKGAAYKGGKVQDFYVKKGDQLVQTPIEIGITNVNNIEIIGGANEGDVIAISDLSKYNNQKTIQLNPDK